MGVQVSLSERFNLGALYEMWMVFRRNKAALTGLILFIAIVLMAIFAPYIAPYNPYETVGAPFQPPSEEHPLGTNDVGQDLLSELIYGARISLFIGFVAAVVGTFIGTFIGLSAGYFGGLVDEALMRFTDMWLSMPTLLFTIFLAAVITRIGTFPMLYGIILAIALTAWPSVARMVRSAVLSLKESLYVEAARAIGVPSRRILVKHILPNVAPLIIIEVITRMAIAMLTEASLSFLGLGDPTAKSWGMMIHYAMIRNAITLGMWWWFLPPGIMISITVLAFMLMGLGLEEYFNPRLRYKEQ
jgi:ABC-type dipeptide/oligopeptide/nickel transport system permease subunit